MIMQYNGPLRPLLLLYLYIDYLSGMRYLIVFLMQPLPWCLKVMGRTCNL